MNPAAVNPFSVAPADIIVNVYQTLPGTPNTSGIGPNGSYVTQTFDLTPYAGQTIRLRFADVSNQNYLLFGIDDVSISVGPQAPSNLQGKKVKNKFLSGTEIVNVLVWNPSPDPSTVSYNVRRDNILIITLPSSETSYEDHEGLTWWVQNTYEVTAVDVNGNESTTILITL